MHLKSYTDSSAALIDALGATGHAGSALRHGRHRFQIQTTQKYLHALPDADRKNLDALDRIARGKGT
jgi:hypothetical protein